MDHESQIPMVLYGLKSFDKNSDIFSVHRSIGLFDVFSKKGSGQMVQSIEEEISEEKVQYYFNLLFSPKTVADSLIRRNQFLEMKCLDNSESQPQQMYKRRKKRVMDLKEKQSKKVMILHQIKIKQPEKVKSLAKFMKLFGQVKQKINGIRHDYYSEKTFLTLKKASNQQIQRATKVLTQVLNQVLIQVNKLRYQSQKQYQQRLIQIYIQYLIIPRFFISKQKLMKIINNESIQQNFKLLITNRCLGHYNNQANKRLPQDSQMNYVRQILASTDGRQKFKKICTINHGGHFVKKNGNQLYYQLYYKSLDCLKKIDQLCKKEYKLEQLKEEMSKQQIRPMSQIEYPKIGIQNDLKIAQFDMEMIYENSISQLIKLSPNDLYINNTKEGTSMLNSTTIQSNVNLMQNSKCKLRRPQSLAAPSQAQLKGFALKRSQTFQINKQAPNIILVHPPSQYNDIFNQNL